MKLTEVERSSAAWMKLKEEINNQIVIMRNLNDGDLDYEKTLRLRGRISALKGLLAWGEPDQVLPVADEP